MVIPLAPQCVAPSRLVQAGVAHPYFIALRITMETASAPSSGAI